MTRKYEVTAEQALLIFKVVDTECSTLKNAIISAVECEDLAKAKRYTTQLRKYQEIYAMMNVDVHRDIDAVIK